MKNMKHTKESCCCPKEKNYTIKNSPIPNDGTFISPSKNSSFSQEGTVRYGEEADADDL